MSLSRVPELDALQLLLRVADTGSLGRAAAEHGVSQPAASVRVKGMERLVGFALLVRSARGSTLTPEGALLADWARDVISSAEVLAAGIASLRTEGEQRLRVAASFTVAEQLLPRWLVRLTGSRPDVAVSLAAMNSAEVAASLQRRDVELGFVEGPQLPAGLDSEVVARDRLLVVVAPGHPWARRRRPIDAAELASTRMVQREPTSGTRAALETALSEAGAQTDDRPAPVAEPLLELSTTSAVRSAVIAAAGPAVLSNLAVAEDIAAGRMVAVSVRGVDLRRVLRASWRHGHRLSRPAVDLLMIARRSRPATG